MSTEYLQLLDIENIVPILDKISIFGGLSQTQLYKIFRILEIASYKKDELIFEQGDSPTHIYIVKSGRVRLFIEEDYTPLQLFEFLPGECFGQVSLIGIMPHTANAICMENTELIVLSKSALHSLYKEDIQLFSLIILNIARETCRTLAKTDDILKHYALKK